MSANRLELNHLAADGLLATPEGREVLSFIISCAIDEGESLVATYDGVDYEFYGELGLAEHWLTHPLDRKGQGWISACLFARVNANNVTVPISLRGAHARLTVSPEEAAGWTLQEGAFYGNYFRPIEQPILWVACRGTDQAAGETGGLVDRDCAEEDPANPGYTYCGFIYAGDCTDACARYSEAGTYYGKCRVTADPHDDANEDELDWNNLHKLRQVITTYVTP
ncbi:MAG TPA: hypothetical protein VFQ53_39200 [Kofleriaceae bacterium]|nr:hypothetical protein [Kofleriaceae bacterium]